MIEEIPLLKNNYWEDFQENITIIYDCVRIGNVSPELMMNLGKVHIDLP